MSPHRHLLCCSRSMPPPRKGCWRTCGRYADASEVLTQLPCQDCGESMRLGAELRHSHKSHHQPQDRSVEKPDRVAPFLKLFLPLGSCLRNCGSDRSGHGQNILLDIRDCDQAFLVGNGSQPKRCAPRFPPHSIPAHFARAPPSTLLDLHPSPTANAVEHRQHHEC